MKGEANLRNSILIVDDSKEIRDWLNVDLQSRGYRVHAVGNGEACLEILERQCPDFIILDLMMPGETLLREFFTTHCLFLESTLQVGSASLLVRQDNHQILFKAIMPSIPKMVPHLRYLLKDSSQSISLKTLHLLSQNTGFRREFGELYLHLDGYTVCRLIHTATCLKKKPRVFIFTAVPTDNGMQSQLHDLGIEGFFLKSKYYSELLPKLKSYSTIGI